MTADRSNPSEHPIDALLKEWADSQQPEARVFDALAGRIGAAASKPADVSAEQAGGAAKVEVARRFGRRALGTAATILALAASILIGIVLRHDGATNSQGTSLSESGKGAHVSTEPRFEWPQQIVRADFNRQRQLIEKLTSISKQPLAWLAETDEELQVEFEEVDEDSKLSTRQPWLLVRLAVERRPIERSDVDGAMTIADPSPFWQVDLAVHSEERVTVAGKNGTSSTVVLWTCMTEDGLVMVDTQYRLDGHPSATDNQTHLMRPGTRTRLAQLDEQYELWQYIDVMRDADRSAS
ncbi:MAG: hypothetical protein U0892_19575 [Pirellulales bacterium]